MHYFAIQVSNPVVLTPVKGQVEYLYQAIQEIFPDTTEEAYLLWNWIPVRIDYKYDLYMLIDDIPPLLDALLNSDKGSQRVCWGSNSFRAEWKLEWASNRLIIASQWDSIAGNYEDLLNSRSQLEIEQDMFLWEWKALLRKVIEAIDFTGIKIANQEELNSLCKLEAAITRLGRRYATP